MKQVIELWVSLYLFVSLYSQPLAYYATGINAGSGISCHFESEMDYPFADYSVGRAHGFNMSCHYEGEMSPRLSNYTLGVDDGFGLSCHFESEMNLRLGNYVVGVNDGVTSSCRFEGEMEHRVSHYKAGRNDGFFSSCTGLIPLPIQLINGACECQGSQTILYWEVSSDETDYSFSFDLSYDGKKWDPISLNVEQKNGFNSIYFYALSPHNADDNTYYRVYAHTPYDSRLLFECAITCSQEEEHVYLFPNPAKQWIIVSSDKYSLNEVIIKDILGQTVFDIATSSTFLSIEISSFRSGAYFVECFYGDHYFKRFTLIKD